MPLTKFQKNMGIISGCMGVLQATAWFIMSVICLVYYYQGADVDPFSYSFSSAVYLRFLDQNSQIPFDVIATPKAFTAFMWVYVVLDVIWGIISLFQVYEVKNGNPKLSKTLKTFASTAILISIFDGVLAVGIGMDISKSCSQDASEQIITLCLNAEIPVLIIVVKGCVLLIFNVYSGFIMYKAGKALKIEEVRNAVTELPTISTIQVSPSEILETEDNSSDGYTTPQYGYEYRYDYRLRPVTRYNGFNYEYSYEYTYGLELEWGPITRN